MLYPLLFTPSYHYRIWAGNKLKENWNKDYAEKSVGESWEISSVKGFVSVLENGNLQGKNLNELIAEFKDKLVGTRVFTQFGMEFPLLIKFINAAEPLSVQVHPDDDYAKKHHQSFGKTEMWYILEAEKEAELIIGFTENTTKELYQKKLEEAKLETILQKVSVEKNDAIFIPAKRVHAIGKGITLAEIQQTSDITYRIYDYNRIEKNGKPRELHTKQALEVSDFSHIKEPKINYEKNKEGKTTVTKTNFFTTNRWKISDKTTLKISEESFTILICTEGEFTIKHLENEYFVEKGTTILLPSSLQNVIIIPKKKCEFLEVYV